MQIMEENTKVIRAEVMQSMTMDETTAYIAEHLTFLRPNEYVLLCYADREEGSIGWIFHQAIRRRGGVPIWIEPDLRWKTMLRQAFSSRAVAVVGEPLVILGLVKLAKFNRTPLYIRHAVTTGYTCKAWMHEAIVKGLDCQVYDYSDLTEQSMEIPAEDPVLEQLRAELHGWSSILDCSVYRGGYGLELELVVFPREKLPALPSCARQVVCAWDPERDVPFPLDKTRKIPVFPLEYH